MRALCAQCQHVFVVEGDAPTQTCPQCGATLHLDIGRGPATPTTGTGGDDDGRFGAGAAASSADSGGAPGGPSGMGRVPTPWERRDELGFFKGLIDTLVASVKRPVEFFSRMPTDNAKGAVSYYWLVAGTAMVFGGLWTALLSLLSGASADQLSKMEELQGLAESMEGPARAAFGMLLPALQATASPGSTLLCQVFTALFLTPLQLLIWAGLFHLFAMLVGAAKNGFNATLRACGYAAAPLLLSVVPLCGAALGGLGWIILLIVGFAHLQQVSYAKAALVYFMPLILCCACACAGALALGIGAASMASATEQLSSLLGSASPLSALTSLILRP